MKMSFSFSDTQGNALKSLAKEIAEGNDSLVVSAALAQFLRLEAHKQRSIVMRHKAERGNLARSTWIRLFWTWLGENLNVPEWNPNPYAPRQFGDFIAVLLFKDMGRAPDEDEDFYVHVFEQAQPLRMNWTFPRNDSPARCAEEVANFILNQRASSAHDEEVVNERARLFIKVLGLRHNLSSETDRAALIERVGDYQEYENFLPNDRPLLRSATINAAYKLLGPA